MIALRVFLFFLLNVLSGCQKEYTFSLFNQPNENVTIFIQMPTIHQSEKEIPVALYHELVSVFSLAGYQNTNQTAPYKLTTTIIDYIVDDKLISPDIFLVHYHVTLVVEFILYDKNGTVLFEKCFSKKEIFNVPQDAALNDHFFYYTLRNMLNSIAQQAEFYISALLFKK